MESKHFSHDHPLAFHQVNPGSQTHCSGCKSPASGNVYVCWQCSYFLHEHCFRATRSFRHPSHPLHPLSLVPFPTYPSASFFCNTCNLSGDGFSYSCAACDFDIHLHCALTPNLNPNPIPSYPNPNLAPPHDYSINPHPQNALYPPPNPNLIQPYPPQPQPLQNQNQAPNYAPPQPQPLQNQNQAPNYAPTGYPQTQEQYPPMAYPQPNPPPQNYAPPPNPPQPQPNPPPPIYSTVTTAAAVTPPPQPAPPQTASPQPKPNPSIIKHFSHPHVLKQMEIEKSKAKVCSACECELSGAAYCCTEGYCTFNLHKSCFDSPQELKHKSHLEHPLKLLAAPPYSDGFTCNACLKDGKAFCYNCADCSYDLHIDCVQWPDTVKRSDHDHNLTLYYSSPSQAESNTESVFVCDVCNNPVHEMAWVYFCRECDFGTHLECVASGIQPQGGGGAAKTEEELLREVELKFAVLQLLLGAQGDKAAINAI